MHVSGGEVHALQIESVAIVGEDRVSKLAFCGSWVCPFAKQLTLNNIIAGCS